jgi:hypothetical protein
VLTDCPIGVCDNRSHELQAAFLMPFQRGGIIVFGVANEFDGNIIVLTSMELDDEILDPTISKVMLADWYSRKVEVLIHRDEVYRRAMQCAVGRR